MNLDQWKQDYEARRRAKLDFIEHGRKQAILEHFEGPAAATERSPLPNGGA